MEAFTCMNKTGGHGCGISANVHNIDAMLKLESFLIPSWHKKNFAFLVAWFSTAKT
jgi:hypothetical protein